MASITTPYKMTREESAVEVERLSRNLYPPLTLYKQLSRAPLASFGIVPAKVFPSSSTTSEKEASKAINRAVDEYLTSMALLQVLAMYSFLLFGNPHPEIGRLYNMLLLNPPHSEAAKRYAELHLGVGDFTFNSAPSAVDMWEKSNTTWAEYWAKAATPVDKMLRHCIHKYNLTSTARIYGQVTEYPLAKDMVSAYQEVVKGALQIRSASGVEPYEVLQSRPYIRLYATSTDSKEGMVILKEGLRLSKVYARLAVAFLGILDAIWQANKMREQVVSGELISLSRVTDSAALNTFPRYKGGRGELFVRYAGSSQGDTVSALKVIHEAEQYVERVCSAADAILYNSDKKASEADLDKFHLWGPAEGIRFGQEVHKVSGEIPMGPQSTTGILSSYNSSQGVPIVQHPYRGFSLLGAFLLERVRVSNVVSKTFYDQVWTVRDYFKALEMIRLEEAAAAAEASMDEVTKAARGQFIGDPLPEDAPQESGTESNEEGPAVKSE